MPSRIARRALLAGMRAANGRGRSQAASGLTYPPRWDPVGCGFRTIRTEGGNQMGKGYGYYGNRAMNTTMLYIISSFTPVP